MADRTAYDTTDPIVTPGMAGKLTAIGGAITIATGDLALNATTGLFKVAKGFNVVHLIGKITDVDTGGSAALVFDIGVTGNTNLFVAASTAGQAGGAVSLSTEGIGYHFDADGEVFMTATTAAATAAAGTLTLYLIGYFD